MEISPIPVRVGNAILVGAWQMPGLQINPLRFYKLAFGRRIQPVSLLQITSSAEAMNLCPNANEG